MARKSNKTEQVLKLLTKEQETSESQPEQEEPEKSQPEQEPREKGLPENEALEKSEPKKEIPVVETSVKSPENEQELKVEAKLKIELEPSFEMKAKEPQEVKLTVPLPEENSGSAYMERNGHLVNLAELLTNEKIKQVMDRMKVCSCPTCVNDVLALALNSLPTKYVTTDAGKQFFQLDIYKKQYETDILAALTKACVRVKASPRH